MRAWISGTAFQKLPDVPEEALLAARPHPPLQGALEAISLDAQSLLCDSIVLNSTATLDASADGSAIVDNGNRTETALLRFAAGLGADAAAGRAAADVVAALPFSSERKRMATVVRRPVRVRNGAGDGVETLAGEDAVGGLTVYVKGAAEV